MSPFKQRVIDIVRAIPYGKVASYGQVALFAGVPRAARQVGWVLNSTEGKIDLPWWRVINNKGRITIKGTKFNDRQLQRKLLQAEKVEVTDDFDIAIEQYRWRVTPQEVRTFQLSDTYIQRIINTYGI